METNVNQGIEATNLRYVLFLIDSKIKDHDGKIFSSVNDAKGYAKDTIADNYADKAVIGMFYLDSSSREMRITLVETIGFTGDKKQVEQLKLFKK